MSKSPGRFARFWDIVWEGVLHVVRRPLRSALTALNSAVAIAVTVNVISLSYGMDEDIQRDVRQFGRYTVDVGRLPILRPGMRREDLGEKQVQQIRDLVRDIPGASVVPRRQVSGSIEGDVKLDRVQIVGAAPDYVHTLNIDVAAGRWLRDADAVANASCTLDAETAQQVFPGVDAEDVIGRTVKVALPDDTRSMTVVGVLADPLTYRALFESFDEGRGARTLTSSLLSFRNVYVPAGAVTAEQYTGISVALPNDAAVTQARDRLLTVFKQDATQGLMGLTSNIGVFCRRDWMDAMGAQTQQGALIGNIVWIIIVGVAVIMISTLNLITIRERYDELAVRRCEGARRRDVALQITVEGVLMSLVGGLAGLPLGYWGASVLRDIVNFPFRFDAGYAMVATGIAIVLGLFSSVVPARRAAKLQPARVLGRRLT